MVRVRRRRRGRCRCRRRSGRDPARPLRAGRRSADASTARRSRAVPLPRQGQRRDDRPREGGRRRRPRQLSGFVAWITWLGVHLFYLIGFQNRVLVILRWTVSFFTHGRGERLITARRTQGRALKTTPVERAQGEPEREHDGGGVRARDEALDEPGEDEPRHRAEHDADRAPRPLYAAPRRAWRTGLDERPPHAQPCRGGDRDARELEHAVPDEQPQEVAAVAAWPRGPPRPPAGCRWWPGRNRSAGQA